VLHGSRTSIDPSFVIAGLDPAIHDEAQRMTSVRSQVLRGLMDAPVKPGHDAECVVSVLGEACGPAHNSGSNR